MYFFQFGPTLSRVNPQSKDLAADVSMQNLAVRLVSPTSSVMFSVELAKNLRHNSAGTSQMSNEIKRIESFDNFLLTRRVFKN